HLPSYYLAYVIRLADRVSHQPTQAITPLRLIKRKRSLLDLQDLEVIAGKVATRSGSQLLLDYTLLECREAQSISTALTHLRRVAGV
ncbi:MAG TPA: hypothetical protein VGP85_15255, partial [Pyrinomonadaceae bacterium]|nr:hypothetical protein [Pyrinomonadaceae bacterium]